MAAMSVGFFFGIRHLLLHEAARFSIDLDVPLTLAG
jgi:hypothetical protein